MAGLIVAGTAWAGIAQQAPVEPAGSAPTHGQAHVEWGYTGAVDASHWAELSQSYAICSTGQQESPIDLRGATDARLGTLALSWKPFPLAATNNGHTVQFDTPAGSSFALQGKRYDLAQFHIHHPSEHLLNGVRFPLELHFVHKRADGVIGVIGVLVAEGSTNPVLQKVIDTVPATRDATRTGPVLDPNALLPVGRQFFRYEGSLTTPPCTESVDWVVLARPITASKAQIEQFQSVFPFNARPIQALNRRFLLRSL